MFPLLSTIVSTAIAAFVWNQYRVRRKPYQWVWALAFTFFAAASAAEWVAQAWGWSAVLAQSYYLFGATLTTGYLGLGLVWLLWPGRSAHVATIVTIGLSIASAVSLFAAPVDVAALGALGWRAMTRPPVARAVSLLFNIGGTMLLVSGTLHSAWRMRHRPELRFRSLGLAILTTGVLIVAAGGSMVGVLNLSEPDTLAITNSLGAVVILTGIWLADQRPSVAVTDPAGTSSPSARSGSVHQ